jgi:RNA recognition motif-containing protein
MENKLYVGNLAYQVTEDELGSMFAEAGNVKSVVIITDRETGRSKGFGFVEMDTDAEAQAAIDRFHGVEMNRRALTVNVARPREERSEGGGGGFRGGDRRGGGGYGGGGGRGGYGRGRN